SGNYYLLAIGSGAGKIATVPSTSANAGVHTANAYNDGHWHHVVALRDTNEIYVDGAKVDTQSENNDFSAVDTNVVEIGRRSTGSYFPGSVDDVRIYNRALSAAEIQQLYGEGKSRPDLDDLRFTAADGKTLLPYWIENDSKAWVKIPTLTGSADTNIYYYFGNKNATTASSDTNTFVRVVSGLVGGWDFSEGSGTTAYDRSGNNNTGTIFNGATWAADRKGNSNSALSFDGIDDYVDCGIGSSLNITGAVTMEAWTKVADASSTQYIVSKRSFDIYLGSTEQPQFQTRAADDGLETNVIWPTPLTIGSWYHIVATYDPATDLKNLYVNNVPKSPAVSKTDDAMSDNSTRHLKIAVGSTDPHYSPNTIDNVHVYNRALSTDEISDLYNINHVTLIAPNKVLVRNYVSSAPTLPTTGPEESKPNETGVGGSGGVLMF
ncbi:MAG TPA: DUF2341 domain-containing protein, partial [Methylococcales bacterium]